MAVGDLLHSWDDVSPAHLAAVQIEDDTLRDGLQGAYLRQPCQADKIDTLRRSAALGVRYHMLGFPASSPRELADCRALLRVIKEERLAVVPRFLARARREDIECIAGLNDEFALEIWADFFVATSPLRRAIEGWELADVVAKVQTAGQYAASRGCSFGVSLEDSSRTRGADLAAVIAVAAEVGAGYLTLCDTAGALSPTGARKLTRFVREHLAIFIEQRVEFDLENHRRGAEFVALHPHRMHFADEADGAAIEQHAGRTPRMQRRVGGALELGAEVAPWDACEPAGTTG